MRRTGELFSKVELELPVQGAMPVLKLVLYIREHVLNSSEHFNSLFRHCDI